MNVPKPKLIDWGFFRDQAIRDLPLIITAYLLGIALILFIIEEKPEKEREKRYLDPKDIRAI